MTPPIDYNKPCYETLTPLRRLWLRVLLWYHQWEAENDTRLIARIQDEVDRGIADDGELTYYKMRRIRHWNRKNEIKRRLGIA